MFLADNELRALLPELDFHTADLSLRFDSEAQIQPCSIDLRLDEVFWRPLGSKTLDLSRSRLLEMSPRTNWKRISVHGSQGIRLAPGEMLLARTYEEFSIPKRVAGKIEGRSSFGRLGLLIQCSGALVNPGWRGRIPLQLVNVSGSPIRVTPFIPICQLLVIPLSSQPARPYGAEGLSSKYMDDDGGPSYWWRDQRIAALQATLGTKDVSAQIQDEILQLIGDVDVEIVGRLEDFVTHLPRAELTNTQEILEGFALLEKRLKWRKTVLRDIAIGCAPLLIACSVGSLFSQPFGSTTYSWMHYMLWIISLLSFPVSIMAARSEVGDFLTTIRKAKIQPQAVRDGK